MRVAMYGTGGAGGYFGAQLARTGEDVTFVARGQHLKAIQAHGLCVETPAGEIAIQPAKATDDPMQVSQERSRHRARERRYRGSRLSWIACLALVLWCGINL
jgi:choline dehydrogenase-like flavoprotein